MDAAAPIPRPPAGPVLIITLSPNGDVNVNGSINDKILSLGMLELARKAILDYVPRRIVPSHVVPGNGLGN